MTGAGISTASLAAGGAPGSAPNHDAYTETWDGSTWTEVADLNAARREFMGSGATNTAMTTAGGQSESASPGKNTNLSELWDGSSWSNTSALITGNIYGTFAGTTSDAIVIGGVPSVHLETTAQLWDGTTWTETSKLISGTPYGGGGHGAAASGRVGVGTLAGGAHKFGGGVFSTPASELFSAFTTSGSFGRVEGAFFGDGSGIASTLARVTGLVTGSAQLAADISGSFNKGFELFNSISGSAVAGSGISGSASSTGSFGLVKPRGGGINTKAFQITSGLFQLPVFTDRQLNYQAYEPQLQTGSLSGSVDRVADVIVGQKLGEMWFDGDKNAVGYTYQSRSLTSQSLSFGTFTNISASGAYQSSSQGFFTQSFYNYAVVTCYLTASISY